MTSPNIVVIGTGMAGLGAAHHFHEAGIAVRAFDKNAHAGGHTYSHVYSDTGFIFDEGPHVSFSKDTRIQDLLAGNVGGRFEHMKVDVNNYYYGAWVKHPAQANLHNIPQDLKVRCILDFIEASKTEMVEKPRNYMEWLVSAFGETFATHFPAVYGKKYHTTEAENMSTVWMGPRLYRPSLEEVIRGAIFEETKDVHYIPNFRYPSEGGFVSYLTPFIEKTDIHLNHKVVEIDPASKTVTFENGARETYDHLVSSMPLPELIPVIKGVPDDVRAAADKLACTSCVTVNVGLPRNDFTQAAWTYIYDEDISFTRLSYPHKMSPGNCPPGAGAIQAECYYSRKYHPLTVSADDLIEPVISDLKKIGLLRDDDEILHADARFIPYANVIFDLDREEVLPKVHTWLDAAGIFYAGRYGEWGYQWTDESFKSGERAARQILERL
ncbi:MAG: FAD-dependent oxidoreductase [Paracoccaceae bacterium]|nr:FAD-dependent oxidoreductase [Paracoccaceae bacterium]